MPDNPLPEKLPPTVTQLREKVLDLEAKNATLLARLEIMEKKVLVAETPEADNRRGGSEKPIPRAGRRGYWGSKG